MGTTTERYTPALLVFHVGGLRLALRLSQVQRVLRSVEVTPLPAAPEIVRGVIDVQGLVIAVIDVRPRFGLPLRAISIHDQLVIARAKEKTVALIAGAVDGIRECSPDEYVDSVNIAQGLDAVAGIVRFADGLVVIHDLDTFLSAAEERELDDALARDA